MVKVDLKQATVGEASREEVFEALRLDIIFGRLRPRERLLEGELSERFGTGRYVIRAAFDELARVGLVQQRPNRGVVISDYSIDEVDQMYDMRALLQTEAARRIPLPASDELVGRLEGTNEAYLKSIRDSDLAEAARQNDLFHSTLFGACGNRYLAADIETYWQKTASIHCYAIGMPQLASKSVDEHSGMIEALKTGNREELVRLCVEHMQPALNAFRTAHGGWGR